MDALPPMQPVWTDGQYHIGPLEPLWPSTYAYSAFGGGRSFGGSYSSGSSSRRAFLASFATASPSTSAAQSPISTDTTASPAITQTSYIGSTAASPAVATSGTDSYTTDYLTTDTGVVGVSANPSSPISLAGVTTTSGSSIAVKTTVRAGTLTFNGSNSYTGSTAVVSGVLSTQTGCIGTSLTRSGTGSLASGALTFDAATFGSINIYPPINGVTAILTAPTIIPGGSLNIHGSGYPNNPVPTNGLVLTNVIPEPATATALLCGFAMVTLSLRRR